MNHKKSAPLQPGDALRHYRIERQIGAGGMGIVYEARHDTLDYRVAIKEFALASPSDDTDTEARALHKAALDAFIAEARLLITLDHEAIPAEGADIPKVHDLFEEAGRWYLVMEYISGNTFEDILLERNRPIAVEEAVRWGEAILRTLTFLHGHEPPIVHRDIKPGNLKLNEQGRVVILDFGIAKSETVVTQEQRTASTSQFVSVYYSPPEQLRGRGTDGRSDLFALAATLYYLMTGQRPPDAQERVNTTLLDRQPDPLRLASEVNPAIPRHVALAVQQALAIKPDQRYQSADAFRRQLTDPWGQAADYTGGLAQNETGAARQGRTPITGPVQTGVFLNDDPSEPTADVVYRFAPVGGARRLPMMMAAALVLLLVGAALFSVWRGWLAAPAAASAATEGVGVAAPTAEAESANAGEVIAMAVSSPTPAPTFTPSGLPTAVSGGAVSAPAGAATSTRLPTLTVVPTETETPTETATASPTQAAATATRTTAPPTATFAPTQVVASPTAAPTQTTAPEPTVPLLPSSTPPPPPPPTATRSTARPPVVVRDVVAWAQVSVNDLLTLTWDGGGGPIGPGEAAYIRVFQNGAFVRNIAIPNIEWNSQNFFPFRASQVTGGTDQFGKFTVFVELVDVNGNSMTRSQMWEYEVGP